MEAIKAIDDGMFSPDQPDRFKPIAAALLAYDHFMVAADFDAYWDAQRKVDLAFVQPGWWRSSILNTSRMGWFSSDRAIREYAKEIWAVPVAES
jgi:starch phosphorylase